MDEPNGKTRFFEGRINSQQHNEFKLVYSGLASMGIMQKRMAIRNS